MSITLTVFFFSKINSVYQIQNDTWVTQDLKKHVVLAIHTRPPPNKRDKDKKISPPPPPPPLLTACGVLLKRKQLVVWTSKVSMAFKGEKT